MRSLIASLGVLLAACSASGGGVGDAGLDGRRDSGPLRRDARLDRQREAAPDARVDPGGDASVVVDAGGGDAQPTLATVLYAATGDPATFGLRTVSTAKPGSPSLLPAWSGYLDILPLAITGLQEQVPVSPGRPQVMANQPAGFQGIRLPGGAGLYHLRRKLLGTSALLLVGVDGSLVALRELPGLYPETIGSHLALQPDGKLGAALAGAAGVFLFRTDGKPLAGGVAPGKDISAASGIATVQARSLTLAGSWLYAVGRETGGKDVLLRAPADGSAPLSPLTLPASAGQPPAAMATGLATSADGKWLAVQAGAGHGQYDLYLVEVQSGAARNLTESPGELVDRGDSFGHQSARLALSPAGGLVAFVRNLAGVAELFVARGDGSSPPLQVSAQDRFKPEVAQFSNLHLADEQNLIFMAGVSGTQQDVYRFDQANGALTNLTGSGAAPFDGKGAYAAQAGWVSPSGGWLYLVLGQGAAQPADLVGVSTKTFGVVKVTSGAEVQATAGSFAACPSSGQLFFAARPDAKLYPDEILSFDQESPQPAQQRTAVSGSNYFSIYDLLLSADCSRLLWSGGGAYALRELWLLPTQGGPVSKLTPAPVFVGRSAAFSPDQATVVYSSGGTSTAATLKAVPVAPGPPVSLDPSAGLVHVFAVY